MPNYIEEVKAIAAVKCVALGEDCAEDQVVEVVEDNPRTVEEKIRTLEERVYFLTNALDSVFERVKELSSTLYKEKDDNLKKVIEAKKKENKVEIPEGTILIGTTKGLSYFMHTRESGFYVGVTKYDSLSAAAEGVSGTRRSGWTFWKLPDGRTVKEAFKG
jgi:hypothetical protein